MAIEWSVDAIAAIDRIKERISAYAGSESADRWLSRVVERVELAELLPFASLKVPEFDVVTFREVREDDYRILFRITALGIEVATVFHGSMALEP